MANNTYAGITSQQNADLKNVNNLYDNMVNNSDKFYQQQIKAANDYKTTHTQIQNQQTDQAVKELNQQKEYQRQDYVRDQKGAYADWQKQSNQYGANAEANAKMINSGYAESSQVQMYTAYQNRVATARQTYTRAVTDYDNKITNARLQNSAKLAEIAYNTLQKTLELSLQGFQYKNTLLQQKLTAQNDIKDRYYTRWNDLRNHLMQEKQFKESVRQFNKEYELKKKSFSSGSGGGGGGYSYSSGGSGGSSGGAKLTKTSGKSTKTSKKYTAGGGGKAKGGGGKGAFGGGGSMGGRGSSSVWTKLKNLFKGSSKNGGIR